MKRKRIFYVPGTITLLGLCTWLVFWHPPPPPMRPQVIRFSIPTDNDKTGFKYSRASLLKIIAHMKISRINLNEACYGCDSDYIAQKFAFIRREVQRLQFTHDTSSVVIVHLGENNTYGQFIRLIRLAKSLGVRRYSLLDADFFFFANPAEEAKTIDSNPRVIPALYL